MKNIKKYFYILLSLVVLVTFPIYTHALGIPIPQSVSPQKQMGCMNIYRNLRPGMAGRDVATLQSLLAHDPTIYVTTIISGFYGSQTMAAVRRFQTRYHIVSGGSPQTTGYGSVGLRTRAVLANCARDTKIVLNQTPVPALVEPTHSPEVQWFLGAHAGLKKTFTDSFGTRENPVAWSYGAYLRAYINMYEATGDVEVLRRLDELLNIVANGNDSITRYPDEILGTVMPGWGHTYGGIYGPRGGARHVDITLNGLYMYPMASFARIVKKTPALQAEFGADADRYLSQIADIFQAFNGFF